MTGFEGIGDFDSDDPFERYRAHQAAKGHTGPGPLVAYEDTEFRANPLVKEWKDGERAIAAIFGRCESEFNHGLRCIRAAGHDGGHWMQCDDD